MNLKHYGLSSGIVYALGSAVLFGSATPLSKVLLGVLDPVLLAGLLYLGSGLGLGAWQLVRSLLLRRPSPEARLSGSDFWWLGWAILCGGVIAPVLLMYGLSITPASAASLTLNVEAVFTVLLAWLVFRENFGWRLGLGIGAITAGGVLLSAGGSGAGWTNIGMLAVLGACFFWALDTNLTRKVSAADPLQIAQLKGIIAGVFNCSLALCKGAAVPSAPHFAAACLVGLVGYGLSLTLFVLALRHIGAARAIAYSSVAPFLGALLAIIFLKDPTPAYFYVAAALMGLGEWLYITERHEHEHSHEVLEHEHSHSHDEQHAHEHDEYAPAGEPHSHRHRHEEVSHCHPHYPDIHHQHDHD